MVNEDCYPSARAIDAVLMRTFFLSADRQLPFRDDYILFLLLILYYVHLVCLILLARQMYCVKYLILIRTVINLLKDGTPFESTVTT